MLKLGAGLLLVLTVLGGAYGLAILATALLSLFGLDLQINIFHVFALFFGVLFAYALWKSSEVGRG